MSMSSKVAAGIWNPVVFKRLTKSWLADELISELNVFYTKAEKTLNTSFITQRKYLKLLGKEEIDFWQKKAGDEMKDYLDPNITEIDHPLQSFAGRVLQAGNLDMMKFLNTCREYFIDKGIYLEERFDYRHLSIGENVAYKNYEANTIIFCEGHLIKDNPFFNHIKLKPAKGDVLTIRCPELKCEEILNKGFFIMPLGEGLFKVGATYNWEDLSDTPNSLGRQELEEKWKKIVRFDYEVVKHEAGVRPSVIDRRPVIGKHPVHQQVMVFNGFGTKGVMLTPYFAKQFVEHIYYGKELDNEVDCRRFEIKNN